MRQGNAVRLNQRRSQGAAGIGAEHDSVLRVATASPGAPKLNASALAAARGGSRDACRYLFVRFGEELHAELIGRGVPSELAASQVMAHFAAIPDKRDGEFDAWLARRALASASPNGD